MIQTGKTENRIWKMGKKNEIPDLSRFGYQFPPHDLLTAKEKVFVCLMKGLLIFAVTFGCVGGVISSFSLNCHMGIVFGMLFFLAISTSLLRIRRLIFDIGYPVMFVIFVLGIGSSFRIVNSGYQNFVSVMQGRYSDYFGLLTLRENDGAYYDPAVSMTYAAIYIGFLLILFLNMIVSEHMSLTGTIVLTFPIFQMGIYIGDYPKFGYLFLLLFGYFFIGLWKVSGHFSLPMTRKDQTAYALSKKKDTYHFYNRINGGIVLQLSGIVLVLSLLFSLLLYSALSSGELKKKANSPLRASIDHKLEIITQNGLMGLFDRYQATGGISEGKLGGVSSIHPDYETDMEVTYVPYSLDSVYLKAYTGTYYTGDSWEAFYPSGEKEMKQYPANDPFYLAELIRQQNYLGSDNVLVRMELKNLDAASNYLYLPYYVSSKNMEYFGKNGGILIGRSEPDQSRECWFYPKENMDQILNYVEHTMADYEAKKSRGRGNSEFDQIYSQVPESIKRDLHAVMEEIGYGKTVEEQIRLIQAYFVKQFVYSMSPGSTPYRQDFVTYFLKTQKRGFCAHFASAATLLLREYGIYARYVEGYCFSPYEAESVLVEGENVNEWISQKGIYPDSQVVRMNITDGDAHAWVEVYYDEIGWVPYEFTVASMEESAFSAGLGLFDLFSNLMRGNGITQTTGQRDLRSRNEDMTSKEITGVVFTNVFLVLFLLLVLIALFMLVRLVFEAFWLRIRFWKGNYEPYLLHCYEQVLDRKKKDPDVVISQRAYELLEKCCFSRDGITKMEAKEALNLFKKMIK